MTDHHRQNDVTAPRWPAPGTTFGPDRLDEVRALLRAWPGRGVWIWSEDGDFSDYPGNNGYTNDSVSDGETWHYVGPHPSDPPDTKPAEPDPARTVVVRTWEFAWSNDGGATWRRCERDTRRDAEAARDVVVQRDCDAGHVVAVDRALPLPVDPAVVVGTVVPMEVADGEA